MRKKLILTTSLIAVISIASVAIVAVLHSKEKEIKKQEDWAAIFKQHYEDRCAQFEEENKTAADIDVVFLGDSLTEGYDVNKFYPQYHVLNRGIGGDTSFGVEKRLKVSVYDASPKVTTLLIGANNFDTMLDNYENILIDFKEKAPEMKVVLLSLTSMTKDWGRNNEKAMTNNVKIKEYSEKYNYPYVDLYNPLLDPDTNELKLEYTIDGGHLTEKGYEVVTAQITPVLESLI